MPLADLMKRPRIAEMAREATPTTNLYETPLRYSSPTSVYAGTPASSGDLQARDALGAVFTDVPDEVYLKDDWIANPRSAGVMAHEGTHSKMIGKNKRIAPEAIKPHIIDLMRNDPEFLEKYTGFKVPYDRMYPKDQEYMLNNDEILARLNSMEAMMPKGSTIEKSKYGKELFKEPGSLDQYLGAIIPEGYLREDKPFTEIANRTTARPQSTGRDALWRSLQNILKR